MKYIELTQGKRCLVDDDDYEELSQWSWCVMNIGYAARRKTISRGNNKLVYMHRELLKTPPGMHTDHKNGDKLDNRKSNLRVCTPSENKMGFRCKRKDASSRHVGVSWNKEKKKWEAYLKVFPKIRKLGYFKNEWEAATARDMAALQRSDKFLHLNYPIS